MTIELFKYKIIDNTLHEINNKKELKDKNVTHFKYKRTEPSRAEQCSTLTLARIINEPKSQLGLDSFTPTSLPNNPLNELSNEQIWSNKRFFLNSSSTSKLPLLIRERLLQYLLI